MKKFLISIIISLGLNNLFCQDATFTLIDHNPLASNPAYALPNNGQFQFLSLSRQQWWNLPGPNAISSGYHMNHASLLLPIISKHDNGLGVGIQLNRNASGEGKLAMTDANFFSASRISWGNKRSIGGDLTAGLGIGLKQYTLDWDQLTFTSQLDPFYGLINSIPQVNPIQGSSSLAISGNVGLKSSFTTKVWQKTISVKSGGAIYHLNKPGISFFDQTEKINRRYSVHGSLIVFPKNNGVIRKVESTYYIFRHNYQYQAPLSTNETRLGTNLNGILTVYLGFRRRLFYVGNESLDAIMWSMQINAPGMIISVAYDYNISELNIQRTRGTSEIGITIPLGTRRNIKSRRAYADYILTNSEWRAVEKFNKTSTNWGREYSPVTFIL